MVRAIRAPKAELVPLVADMHAIGYCAADIAFAVQRSPQYVRRTLLDLGLGRPKLRKLEDLPAHMLERVVAFRTRMATGTAV